MVISENCLPRFKWCIFHFRDFLQRCKDYGITEVTAPQPSDTENDSKVQKIKATQSEQSRLVAMVNTK